jgi:diadenosine tetraphosphatase ApaH/serine/threonine PP2A family protein phosphatase
MRFAILSDVHGNLEALEAVLGDAGRAGVDALISLGDVVGYGPDPAACVEIVRARAEFSLLGNHDAAAAGVASLEDFNEFARWSVEWSAARLDAGQIAWLGSLAYIRRAGASLFAHASPVEPERWHYVHGVADLGEHFAAFSGPLCFVGHSHRPGIYRIAGAAGDARKCGVRETLAQGTRHLVNVGSVGQPRDRDPRACYAIHDEERASVELRRVAYDLERTQAHMRAAGIPAFMIDRLGAGV